MVKTRESEVAPGYPTCAREKWPFGGVEEGKRSDGNMAQATAPLLDSSEEPENLGRVKDGHFGS